MLEWQAILYQPNQTASVFNLWNHQWLKQLSESCICTYQYPALYLQYAIFYHSSDMFHFGENLQITKF